MANFMWNDEEGNHKIHLANWPSICMKKDFGELGIPNLQDLNICLIGSWMKRYIQSEGALWRRVLDAKYNTKTQTSCPAMISSLPPFGRALCGPLRQ
jgi:hypothetical protein